MVSGFPERKIDVDPSSLALLMLVKVQGCKDGTDDPKTTARFDSMCTNTPVDAGYAMPESGAAAEKLPAATVFYPVADAALFGRIAVNRCRPRPLIGSDYRKPASKEANMGSSWPQMVI